jgi:phosphoglycolate phosphatase
MKIILFDLDGTLVTVGGAAKRAFYAAFSQVLGCLPNEAGVTIHGATDPHIYRDVSRATLGREMTLNEQKEVVDLYIKYLSVELDLEPSYRVMPGIPELVKRLAASSEVVLGLQTGNWEQAVSVKLKKSNLYDYFQFGGFGSDGGERSEIVRVAISRAMTSPVSPKDIVVIGDSPQDIRAGKINGLTTIGVATGIYNSEQLSAEDPTYVMEDFSDTNKVLSSIGLN